jgi:DNA mismatch repair protein MutS
MNEKQKSTDKNAGNADAQPAVVTPMMAQFLEIKAVNPGYLLFYRMGDFYELFFEDASIASMALGITLTKRGKHENVDIPMCGVPVKASDVYLKKLISLGYKVAICEQMEEASEAKKRGAKSVVKRDVVRLVSAGTITEDDLLPTKNNNFLCSIAKISHLELDFALAYADVSTGEIWISEIAKNSIADELAKFDPAEILISEKLLKELEGEAIFSTALRENITILSADYFDSMKSIDIIKNAFKDFDISSIGRVALTALSSLVSYVSFSQKETDIALRAPNIEKQASYMAIDVATRSSLELLLTNRGEKKGSLFSVIDMCATASGSRLLARRLAAPLQDKGEIIKRLDMVEVGFKDIIFADDLRQDLRQMPDISRSLTRLMLNRAGPRDLLSLGLAILRAKKLGEKY